MKLVIFSDVHGNKEFVERIFSFNPDADYFISLGDSELSWGYLSSLDILSIKGNAPRDAGIAFERDMEIHGKKIFLTHGHKYKVNKSMKLLLEKGFKGEYDILLYGHTHIAKVDKVKNMLFINPGSVSIPRSSRVGSYMVMNISEDSTVSYEFKEAETNMVINNI